MPAAPPGDGGVLDMDANDPELGAAIREVCAVFSRPCYNAVNAEDGLQESTLLQQQCATAYTPFVDPVVCGHAGC